MPGDRRDIQVGMPPKWDLIFGFLFHSVSYRGGFVDKEIGYAVQITPIQVIK